MFKNGFCNDKVNQLSVTLMVEVAVSTSTQITALIAHVIIKKTVLLGLLPLLLEMVSVMMRRIMQTAIMMVETAVVLVL